MTDLSFGEAGMARDADATGFHFINPGPLVDAELELVTPSRRWIADVLAACHHPLTVAQDPENGRMSRSQIEQFLAAAPGGHEPGEPLRHRSPSYHFWMRLRPEYHPPVPMAGTVSLRIGHGEDLELYFGHIGYNVYPPARGHHLAERACRLLFDLARQHGVRPLWITTDPENQPSRRTCERLGGVLVDIVEVPRDHVLYSRGQRRKCRYRIDL